MKHALGGKAFGQLACQPLLHLGPGALGASDHLVDVANAKFVGHPAGNARDARCDEARCAQDGRLLTRQQPILGFLPHLFGVLPSR